MEDDNSHDIPSILESSMLELKQANEDAYNLVLKKAREGFFADHQTTGSLKKLAGAVLDASAAQREGHES